MTKFRVVRVPVIEYWNELIRGLHLVWGFAAFLLILSATPHTFALAAGDLLVAPTRVVFEGRTRSAQISLVNKGSDRATYRISLVNRRMLEDGRFEDIERPERDELFANGLVRFAPRRVVLEPNAPQTIRVMLRKSRDLPEGEYRSHLMLRAVPDDSAGRSVENLTANQDGLSIQLTPVYGVTVPIIVRHGKLTSEVTITDAEIDQEGSSTGSTSLKVYVTRKGNRSVYGDIRVSRAGGGEVLGQVRGVAVYAPGQIRIVRVPLDPAVLAGLRGKEVQVHYVENAKKDAPVVAQNTVKVR